jgi:AcrR family transcriptional regulator
MNEVKRRYDASGRQERARARRRAMVLAAKELFERDGFQPTTIAAVAERAGVSAESVYKAFGTKAAVAKAVFDFVIAGDDEPVPIAQRPEIQLVIDEPEVRRKIELYVRGFVRRQHRSAKTQVLIRDAGHVDDSAAAVWQNLLDERLTGMTMLGRHLRESGQLRAGLDLVEVRDVLWTFTAVEFYELLVVYRGWSLKRYEQWTAHAIIAALL